jgi:hypothetical protein
VQVALRSLLVTILLATPVAACGTHQEAMVPTTIRRSVAAENAGDAKRFVALWTDTGLAAYGLGTRQEILSGKSHIGEDKIEDVTFVATSVTGPKATTTVESTVELGRNRLRFPLMRTGGTWLIDGFEYLGAAPPPPGTPTVSVTASEYAYQVDTTKLRSGRVALSFANVGKEGHEMTLFRVPEGVSKPDLISALKDVNGKTFEGVPAGYSVAGHLLYAEPGPAQPFTFAKPLTAGRYAFVCYVPVGGFNDKGEPNNPGAPPHMAQGMLTDFTVAP